MVSAWKQDSTRQFFYQFEKHKIGENHRILASILIIGTFTWRALGAHINFAIELIRKSLTVSELLNKFGNAGRKAPTNLKSQVKDVRNNKQAAIF